MRLKLFVGMLSAAAFTLVFLILVRPSDRIFPTASDTGTSTISELVDSSPETKASIAEHSQSSEVEPGVLPEHSASGEMEQISKSEESEAESDNSKHNTYVEARIVELAELSTKSDRSSLVTLLSEVRNPDKQIRQAALDALCQSGNRDAVPGLMELASQADLPEDKRAINEVIEFLKMPTLTELVRGENDNARSGDAVNAVKSPGASGANYARPGQRSGNP